MFFYYQNIKKTYSSIKDNKQKEQNRISIDFYAPNFGLVEGAYWFGPSVRLSVCPPVTLFGS